MGARGKEKSFRDFGRGRDGVSERYGQGQTLDGRQAREDGAKCWIRLGRIQ